MTPAWSPRNPVELSKEDLVGLPPELLKELSKEAQAMIPTKVLPCPFCHRLNWSVRQAKDTKAIFLKCGHCLASGPRCTNRIEAIDAWNAEREK